MIGDPNVHDVKKQAKGMMKNIVSLVATLEPLPRKRFLSMKLYYYDAALQASGDMAYQPPGFVDATDEEEHDPSSDEPLTMKVGAGASRSRATTRSTRQLPAAGRGMVSWYTWTSLWAIDDAEVDRSARAHHGFRNLRPK